VSNPVILTGVGQSLPKGHYVPNIGRWKRPIYVQFLPLIETKGLDVEDRYKFKDDVREKMSKAYHEMLRSVQK